MEGIKIKYGIDLGTTNSAICKMDNGESIVIKTDTLKDTMPSCVEFTKKQSIKVGDTAYNGMKGEKRRATKTWNKANTNTYIEFKRYMGQEHPQQSSYMGRSYTPEELSAEVLKTLKSYIADEQIQSSVITVPAKFTNSQKDATMRAAKLAGITHCELLQEPIAASMAYGLSGKQGDGYWLVFDFGGGTFDAALMRVEDGIIQVFDTEGDNFLGGKDLDAAIVEQIIIPYLKENYVIDDILNAPDKCSILQEAMKTYAEEVKIALSFKESEDIISNLGDLGEDDEGTELELDLTVHQSDLRPVFAPIFQRAVDICTKLLERNNMTGSQLSSLILVGGPTYSPIIREMLKHQVTEKVDTSIDPMTAVARGAALYASTIDSNETVELEQGTIAFDVAYEATSVESLEYVTLKINGQDSTGSIPNAVYVEITRGDGGWGSGKVKIDEMGDVIECQLKEGCANNFIIKAYDEQGTLQTSYPESFTIIQGTKVGSAVLPYNIGIEVYDNLKEKAVFEAIKGLEKNKSLPATGVLNNLKTTSRLRPGVATDFVRIPVYQGEDNTIGRSVISCHHVGEVVISGEDIEKEIPEGSTVEFTLKSDISEQLTLKVFFPLTSEEVETKIESVTQQAQTDDFYREKIKEAENQAINLERTGYEVSDIKRRLSELKSDLRLNKEREGIFTHLKGVLTSIEEKQEGAGWSLIEKDIRSRFNELKNDNSRFGNTESNRKVEQLGEEMERVLAKQDIQLAKEIKKKIGDLNYQVATVLYFASWIHNWHQRFDEISWNNPSRARVLVNQGEDALNNNPTEDSLRPYVVQIVELLPKEEMSSIPVGLMEK